MSGSEASWASNSSYVLNSVVFWASIASPMDLARPGAKPLMKDRMPFIIFFEKATIRKIT